VAASVAAYAVGSTTAGFVVIVEMTGNHFRCLYVASVLATTTNRRIVMQAYNISKNPRAEKLRNFRNRGNHPHGYGIKACNQCGIEYRKWRRKSRLDARRELREFLRQLKNTNNY
jgi:hypothetical protein